MIIGDVITKEEMVELAVEFIVKDIKKSIDFYTNILDFKLHRVHSDDTFTVLFFRKAMLMFYEARNLPEPHFSGIEVRFLVDDIDAYYSEVLARGAEMEKPIFNAPYGLRQFYVKNPEGVSLKFSSVIKK